MELSNCRQQEFSRLKNVTYLDHAGATLYSESQINAFHQDLINNLYGNPHSANPSSKLTSDKVEHVRNKVLRFCNTTSDEYQVIFTSGATAALKLLAETFTFSIDGDPKNDKNQPFFCYLEDNHTSVVGMREIMTAKGAEEKCIPVPNETSSVADKLHTIKKHQIINCSSQNNLFAYPAQSNFSGYKYPLAWIEDVHNLETSSNKWFVLLDAAGYCSTSHLDLKKYQPDFVTLSFYKIFGFPTGLGALIVRNTCVPLLKKTYFGGGTVQMSLTRERLHVDKENLSERFEDGTISYLAIIALQHGFDAMEKIAGNINDISVNTFKLAQYVFNKMKNLKHNNGRPVVKLYSFSDYTDVESQGPVVNFNVLHPDGSYIGFSQVDKLAQLYNIHLRTGCFCNMGACQHHLNMTSETVVNNYKSGHVCGDDKDVIDGMPTGSVRISFGYMSNFDDAREFIKFMEECFVSNKASEQTENTDLGLDVEIVENRFKTSIESSRRKENSCVLTKIFVYPIKSCGAYEVQNWEVDRRGLKYDRHWMIVNSNGVCLSQKLEPKLCLIKPNIDLDANLLYLNYEDSEHISISLSPGNVLNDVGFCSSKVCGDRVIGTDCGDAVADWISNVLDRPGCRLVQQSDTDKREEKRSKGQLSLANEAQYLLISESSVDHLLKEMAEKHNDIVDLDNMVKRFRPNLVVKGTEPFVEDKWTEIKIGDITFENTGRCNRCKMICVDQETGTSSKAALQTLSTYSDRKMTFGIHLTITNTEILPAFLSMDKQVIIH